MAVYTIHFCKWKRIKEVKKMVNCLGKWTHTPDQPANCDMDIIANMIMEDGYKPKTDLENLIIMVLLLFESETEDSSSEFFPTYDFETMAINADGLKRFVYASGGWKEFDYYA